MDEADKYCESNLFQKGESDYGNLHKEHLMHQYEIFVRSVGHISETRQRVNSYFLTLNTLLLTALGVSFSQHVPFVSNGGQLAIPFIGIVVCVVWFIIIFSYKQRSLAKQKILHCLEKELPIAPYSVEWNVLQMDHGGWKYHSFRIILLVPLLFLFLYLFIVLFSV